MDLSEIKPGEVFTIDNTPSYPKIRTHTGYIDMRDEIVKTCTELAWPVEKMTVQQIAIQFKSSEDDIEEWISSFGIKPLP